ncbi:MAG: hypothetical protein PWQ17_1903 [Anaerophaga sp.]|nr:hypothetical protein [Anaerophaga sp.]
MEKDALIEIILHDLNEVETLVKSFKGKPTVSKAFYRLTRNKLNSVLEEIDMLEEITGSSSETTKSSPKYTEKKEQDYFDIEKDTVTATTNNATNKEEISAAASKEKNAEKINTSEKSVPQPSSPIEQKTKEPVSDNAAEEQLQKNTTSAEEGQTQDKDHNEKPVYKSEKSSPETQQQRNDNVIHPSKEQKKDNKVLGEKLVTNKASFNEHIAKKQPENKKKRSLTSPPISDIKKALGINDRFFFQRELFGRNADLMNQTLDQINQMNGIDDARNFLLANFNWDSENEAVIRFMELVERRFL